MTNLEDWVDGIESWGFRVVDYDEDTMYFEGVKSDEDTMVTYRIAPRRLRRLHRHKKPLPIGKCRSQWQAGLSHCLLPQRQLLHSY